MNFEKLYKQYNSYWQSHDLSKAINSLSKIGSYLGSDWTLLNPGTALKPENLLSRYAFDNGYKVTEYQTVADTVSYSNLLKYYSGYLNKLIQEIRDYETKIKALQEKSFFDSLLEGIFSIASLAVPAILLIGLIYIIKK